MSRQAWTKRESEFLRAHYIKAGGPYCAKTLGRSIDSVHWKAGQLNIKERSKLTPDEQAERKGRAAHAKGLTLDACAFSGALAAWWKAGWHDADVEAGNSWL